MLTFEDCIALGSLTDEQVHALAAHEHIPDIVACELGTYLLTMPGGARTIVEGLQADLMDARTQRRFQAVYRLQHLIEEFGQQHPQASD